MTQGCLRIIGILTKNDIYFWLFYSMQYDKYLRAGEVFHMNSKWLFLLNAFRISVK